ncbi:MAG: pyridoxamine 5'-phosphate oxidase family protein [Deltaproteobacteria bacterium]|jgi:hypothetical protein|nr:pyridoxamine 5'-phosphate oxidase family protein [Deltaproteobacteria bacterium]
MEEELKNVVLAYLESHNTLTLATAREGVPHAATVFYVNIGFDIYFLSSPVTLHGEHLALNPRVSATIDEDYSNWLLIKGIQLEGRAADVGGIMQNGRIALAYVKKFPDVKDFFFSPNVLGDLIASQVKGINFYKLTPERIFFIDNKKKFGEREELILSPKG